MTQNQGSEPVPASRTGQLISARDMAMQKFEEGMRLISEASELCGLSLFTSRIMQPNAFGLPSSLDRTIDVNATMFDRYLPFSCPLNTFVTDAVRFSPFHHH